MILMSVLLLNTTFANFMGYENKNGNVSFMGMQVTDDMNKCFLLTIAALISDNLVQREIPAQEKMVTKNIDDISSISNITISSITTKDTNVTNVHKLNDQTENEISITQEHSEIEQIIDKSSPVTLLNNQAENDSVATQPHNIIREHSHMQSDTEKKEMIGNAVTTIVAVELFSDNEEFDRYYGKLSCYNSFEGLGWCAKRDCKEPQKTEEDVRKNVITQNEATQLNANKLKEEEGSVLECIRFLYDNCTVAVIPDIIKEYILDHLLNIDAIVIYQTF